MLYYEQAARNLQEAASQIAQPELFSEGGVLHERTTTFPAGNPHHPGRRRTAPLEVELEKGRI